MSAWENLGPCTIEVTVNAGTPVDFSGEFRGVKIGHEYTTAGEDRTMLDGSKRSATETRRDSVTGNTETDLTAAGLYNLLSTNDMAEADITITQTASTASWTGKVKLKLPADVGADEFGTPIVSSITWQAAGDTQTFAFTPATTTP